MRICNNITCLRCLTADKLDNLYRIVERTIHIDIAALSLGDLMSFICLLLVPTLLIHLNMTDSGILYNPYGFKEFCKIEMCVEEKYK